MNNLNVLHKTKVSLTSPALQRHFLREKEAAQILQEFSHKLKLNVQQLWGSKPRIELVETSTFKIFLVNGKPSLAMFSGSLLPTLTFEEALRLLPKIVVNMGAVPHICNGADIMAPGIVQMRGEFNKNDFLLITDERHDKPLAIGIALMDSQGMMKLKQGKTVKNVHYVGDKLWNLLKQI